MGAGSFQQVRERCTKKSGKVWFLLCLTLPIVAFLISNSCCFFSDEIVVGGDRQNAVLVAHPRALLLPKFAKLPKVAKFIPKNVSSVKYIFV